MEKGLIVITGASSGIGAAVARAFAELGHPLLLLARRLDRIENLKLQNAICKKVDVTKIKEFQAAIDEAEEQYGPTSCLINNAGVMLLGLAHEQNPKEWQQMLDVNVMGVLNGIHSVLPSMIARESGTIINISSVAGRKTFLNHAAYCGTKFAVHALTENIRQEAASHNVRMILIAPGPVETELLSFTTSQEIKDNYTAWKEEIGGALSAEDIAQSIVFAYQQPQRLCIREIVLCPTKQVP
jgi:NADP-dependent 3-hydroxy acid dehydrogenase YdfG